MKAWKLFSVIQVFTQRYIHLKKKGGVDGGCIFSMMLVLQQLNKRGGGWEVGGGRWNSRSLGGRRFGAL